LADEIKENINDIDIDLIKGSIGDFEVVKDGRLIFSKRKEGRFPDSSEIMNELS